MTGIFVLSLVSCDSSDAFFVNAGVDQTVQIGTEVTLVGAAGSPDGTITSYQWSQIAGVAVELTDDNTSTASFTAPMLTTDAILTFRLIVNDDRGGRVTDDVNILVTVPAVTAPTSIAGETISMTITSGAGFFATTGTYTVSFSANQNIYTVTGDGVNVADSAGTYTYSANSNIGLVSIVDSAVGAGSFALTFTSATGGTFFATVVSDPASNQAGTFTQL